MGSEKAHQVISTSLVIGGIVGTMFSAFLARNSAKKEIDILKDCHDKKEKTKKLLKLYTPSIIAESASIAAIIGSNVFGRKAAASMAAVAFLANKGAKKYKKEIISFGKKELNQMKLRVNDSKTDTETKLYFESHVGLFKANPEKLALAYSDINQRLQIEDFGKTSYFAMIYNFLQACDAEILNKELDISELTWGWSAESLEELYGYKWVHMQLIDGVRDDIAVTTIIWQEEPILDPGNGGENFLDRDAVQESHSKFLSAIPVIPD